MTKTLLSTAFVAVLGAVAFLPTAQAASSGTINITGKVIADTCTINVNNSGSSTVPLPAVMTSALNAAGKTAGDTNFNVALSGCDPNVVGAQMAFGGSNVDPSNGYLKNTGTSNVEVQLLSGASIINTSNQTNAPLIAVASGTGSTTLTARYVAASAAATPGLVSTNVNFTLTYQ